MIEFLETRRLFAAGDLDIAFNSDGVAVNQRPDRVYFTDSAVLDNDKVLYSGNEIHLLLAQEDRAVLARFNADGTPDSTFGSGGYLFHDLSAGSSDDSQLNRMIVQSDGKIVALGEIDFKNIIVRFNANGSIDTTFGGGDGMIDNTSFGETFDVLSDGKIIIGGAQGHVTRYLASGILDTDFGDDGTSTFDFPGPDFKVIEAQPDGKILLGGGFGDFVIARLNADGSLDTGFANNGVLTSQPPNAPDYFNRVGDFFVLSDGDILVAGESGTLSSDPNKEDGFSVIRLNSNGTLDQAFGNGGGTFVSFGPFAAFSKVDVDSAGNIYLIGDQGHDGLATTRVTADGDFDEEFGRVVSTSGGAVFSLGGGVDSNDKLILTALVNIGMFDPAQGFREGNFAVTYRVLTDDSAPPTIGLSGGAASLPGTSGNDLLDAIESSQVVYVTRNGFGRVFDTADVQRIVSTGGAGEDLITMRLSTISADADGGDGKDRISGGAAKDTLRGGTGRDRIDGGLSPDLIVGGAALDRIRGEGGADHIYGNGGPDFIYGNGGNDRIDGGAGADEIHGGGGNDTFLALDGEIDQIFGDDGTDSATADDDDVLNSVETT